MQKLKQILFTAILGITFMNPALALAQGSTGTANDTSTKGGIGVTEYSGVQDSLTRFLCTPSESGTDSRALEKCINKMYRFGISFGAIALVFFVVFAGYLYMTGGETGKQKAKGIIQNALIGMGLLLGSYVILSFINPNLVIIKPIQPPIFDAAGFPSCEDIGFSGTCTLADGGIAFGGDEDCAMPIAATAVKSYNNTVHNPWDTNPDTPDKHRTVRVPPNGPPGEGAVDLAVGQVAHPVYAPISGKVTVRKDNALGGTGAYISISSNTTVGSANCDSANACANLAHITPTVNAGDTVQAGQQIGKIFLYSGALGPHLHFELRVAGKWIVGDGKAGTWKNMQAAISQCMTKKANGGGGSVPSGYVDASTVVPELQVEMKYATTDNFMKEKLYTDTRCLLLASTAEKLKIAQEALKKTNKNYRLKVWDCYRPKEVQTKMREWGDKQKPRIDNQYIASVAGGDHPQGRAIDLTIYDVSTQKDLAMPTPFDEFSPRAGQWDSFPNSKILRNVMVDKAKFVPASKEWWHFANKD